MIRVGDLTLNPEKIVAIKFSDNNTVCIYTDAGTFTLAGQDAQTFMAQWNRLYSITKAETVQRKPVAPTNITITEENHRPRRKG